MAVRSLGSRFVALIKGFFARRPAQDAIEKGARALELQLLDRPQAEATNALAQAAATLLSQVKDQDGSVCMQVGSLLLVRFKPDGKTEHHTVVKTLSAVQLRRLQEDHARLDDPDTILSWLGISTRRELPE